MNTHPTIREVQESVAARFGVTIRELLSGRQDNQVARARQVAMWICRHVGVHTLPVIGRHFCRDHTSVMHSLRRFDGLMARDDTVAALVWDLVLTLDPAEAPSLRRARLRQVA